MPRGQEGNVKRSVSVTDVAERAGVSLGTVSNVLNHPDRVAVATRRRVQQVIKELGFVRNEAARQLRAGRSRSIGLIVLDVANPFFTDIAAGVEDAAADQGLSVLLCNSAEDADRERHYVSVLEEHRCYGILLTPVLTVTRQMETIRRRGTAVVLVDYGATPQQCSVSVDDIAGGRLAVKHLLEYGHERIAFVGGPVGIKQVSDRLEGARSAFRSAGKDPERIAVIETDAMNVAGGRTAGQHLTDISVRRRPTAVFCANALLALGVLQEMTRQRIAVPDDMAIVGYDDIDFAGAAAVPLTSVRQPRTQLGRAATELLIDEVERASTHRHRQVVFEPELVVRASSDLLVGKRAKRAASPAGAA
jgi:LacI family transcriptional regulator, galactose operon repressor